MNDRDLRQLLRHADAAPSFAPPRASEIHTALRRRAQRRTVAAATFTILLAALAALALHDRAHPAPAPLIVKNSFPAITPVNPVPDLHDRIMLEANILLAQRHSHDPDFSQNDAIFSRDAAAETLLLSAQRRQKISGPADAVPVYQLTIDLFPETSWAARAHQALDQLKKPEPASSKG